MAQTVLILGGNGKIGSHAADAFWNAGWNVRQFDRAKDDMTQSAMGCDVIVNGLNPPNYHNWSRLIPMITKQVINAAKASGATVILPGNIYNFGNQPGALSEKTPQTPNSQKGQIRKEMEAAYRDAGIRTIVLRAGNFIDPRHNGDVMSLFIMRDIKAGRLTHGGNPSVRQAYAFVPDWARAAVKLAERRDQLAPFEDIPFPGHSFTWKELKCTLEEQTGRTFRLSGFPWWLITAISPFMELARELREMRYLYEMDHWIDGTKFYDLLPDFKPTPLRDVMLAGLPADINPNQTMRASGKPVFAE